MDLIKSRELNNNISNKLHSNSCKEIVMNNELYKLLESMFSDEIIYTNSEELGIVAYIRGIKITVGNVIGDVGNFHPILLRYEDGIDKSCCLYFNEECIYVLPINKDKPITIHFTEFDNSIFQFDNCFDYLEILKKYYNLR